jgi:hypothetical protein
MVLWSSIIHCMAVFAAGVFIGTATAAPAPLMLDNTTWHGSLEERDGDAAGTLGLSARFNGLNAGIEPRAAGNFTLRILPLGASITEGYKSSDGNGYRKALRAQLRYDGWQVNMVGSLPTGTMYDKVCFSPALPLTVHLFCPCSETCVYTTICWRLMS